MNIHGHSQQSDDFATCDDFDDDDDDLVVEPPPRVTLQAAIAWVATRDAAFTFSFQDMNLEKMDALILRAGLSAVATVQGSWVLVRDAIAAGKMNAWGQKFELPANFELGDVWPRGPEEPLSGVELTDMNLVDVRGMAVHPNGIPCVGQTWYCRILIQKDHLQSQFPPRSAQSSQIVERPRDYQLQATIDVLRELTPADIQGIRRDRLLDKVNAILVEERQTQKISIAMPRKILRARLAAGPRQCGARIRDHWGG